MKGGSWVDFLAVVAESSHEFGHALEGPRRWHGLHVNLLLDGVPECLHIADALLADGAPRQRLGAGREGRPHEVFEAARVYDMSAPKLSRPFPAREEVRAAHGAVLAVEVLSASQEVVVEAGHG